MKQKKTHGKIIWIVAAIAIAGIVVYFTRPEPEKPRGKVTVESLRKTVAENPKDYGARIDLAAMLLASALDQSRMLARDEERFVDRPLKDIESATFERDGKALEERREATKGIVDEALKITREARDIDPAKLDAYRAEAKILKFRGKWKQLRNLVDEARAKTAEAKKDIELREASMLAYMGLMQLTKADDEAHQIAAADPKNLLAKLMIARIGLKRRDIALADEALAQAGDAITKTSDPFALECYGILERDRDRPEEAIHHLLSAVALLPELGDFRYELAGAFKKVNDVARLTHQYRMLHRLDKKDPYVYVGRAESLFRDGKEADAFDYLNMAYVVDKENPQILYLNAKFISETGNPVLKKTYMVTARDFIERAAEFSKGESLDILLLQAKIFADMGQYKDAVIAGEKAYDAAVRVGAKGMLTDIRERLNHYTLLRDSEPQEPEQLETRPATTMPATTEPAATSTAPATLPKLEITLPTAAPTQPRKP
jgi:tetratricopeptide (TPR) repeat protein